MGLGAENQRVGPGQMCSAEGYIKESRSGLLVWDRLKRGTGFNLGGIKTYIQTRLRPNFLNHNHKCNRIPKNAIHWMGSSTC